MYISTEDKIKLSKLVCEIRRETSNEDNLESKFGYTLASKKIQTLAAKGKFDYEGKVYKINKSSYQMVAIKLSPKKDSYYTLIIDPKTKFVWFNMGSRDLKSLGKTMGIYGSENVKGVVSFWDNLTARK